MKNKTLFIGCGGSGIKTLMRVNELLSGNPETRQIMRENISYLIFDLDVSDTEAFKSSIRAQVGNAGMPFIKTIQVTRNVTNLEELVRPTFDDLQKIADDDTLPEEARNEASRKLKRLKQNWWYSPSHDPDHPKQSVRSYPFRAQNITEGLNQGAGQCGPVSFLATWNYLPNLKRDLQEAIEAIQLRNTDAQDIGLNVVIVAGTAGGTGRGCWQLIAFKVAQTLREMEFVNNPIGVFFDASCFKNVFEGSPNERLNLNVNSLTAMSELSAWMMQPVIRSFRFALPNLKNPGPELVFPGIEPPVDSTPAEKKAFYDKLYKERGIRPYTASTDVISVPPDGDNELSPITTAYLIFGNNGIASLKNNNQYHEMAAAALYAMVAQDEFIGPGAINRHDAIRSFGAITFEVPTIPIRRYMESMVRREYSQTLYMSAAERPSDKRDQKQKMEDAYILDDEANQLVGVKGKNYSDVDEKALPFFVKTNFCVDDPIRTVSLIMPNLKKPTLMQSLMAKYAEAHFGWQPEGKEDGGVIYPTPTDTLVEALESQDEDEARSAAAEILELRDFDESFIDTALEEFRLGRDSLKKEIQETVLGAFAPDHVFSEAREELMSPSVGRAIAVLHKMKKRLQDSIVNLGVAANDGFGVKIGDSVTVRNIDDCAPQFATHVLEPRSKKNFWEFKRYSKAKVEIISTELQAYLTCALYFKLRKGIVAKFREAIMALVEIERWLDALVSGLKKVEKSFEEELCRACGVKDGDADKAYNELFIEEDEHEVLKALPLMDAHSNVYKRVLKPIMSRDRVKELVRGNIDACEKPIRDALSKFVRDLVRGGVYPTDEDAASAIRKEMVDLISANVALKFDNGSDFMTRNFSFRKVLANNVTFWNRLLASRAGSEDVTGDITDRFRKYLGITGYDIEDGRRRIRFDELWENIVTSMAGDCKPWMELRSNAHETYLTATALIPAYSKEVDETRLRDHVKDKFHGKVINVSLKDGKLGELIPDDRIIVFSAMAVSVHDSENPFDYIQSLDYYKEADYSRLLVKAEDDYELSSYYYPIKNNPAARVKWGEQRDTHGFVSPVFIREESLASTRWRPWKPWRNDNADKKRDADVKSAICFGLLGTGDIPDAAKAALAEAGWADYPLLVQGSTKESLKFARKCQNNKNAWEIKDFSTIGVLMEFLSGKGRKSYRDQGGQALEKEKAAGNLARNAILQEFEAFRDDVVKKVGETVARQLVQALEGWLSERDDVAKDKKEVWQDLYEFVNTGAFTLA